MRTITLVWRAFGDRPMPGYDPAAERTIEVETDLDELALAEKVFAETNTYQGDLWDALQPLPDDRTHTALSVIFNRGDWIIIDGTTWEVAPFGFTKVDTDN